MASSESYSPEERAWIASDEDRWRRARAIAARHPEADIAGIYRVLRNLGKTPPDNTVEMTIDGIPLRVLELRRIIASKR